MKKLERIMNFGFFLLLISLLLSASAKAEFVKITINQTITGVSSYNLDLNGDMTDDYNFQIIELSSNIFAARVTSYGFNSFMDVSVSGFPDALDFGQAINAPFISGNGVLGMGATNSNFDGVGLKYLGINFDIGGNSHLGWISVKLNATNDTLTIFDAAYNTIANDPILAGENSANVGLEKSDEYDLSIYPNPCQSYLTINYSEENVPLEYTIFNMSGSKVLNSIYEGAIDVSNLENGIYLIELYIGDFKRQEKIIIEN